MGIVKRQFFKASAATYVGVFLGYLNITILFPYFCTPEQLGLYRVIINLATMFAAIAYMGTPQAIIKQFPHFKNKFQEKEFYGLIFIMFFVTLLLSFTILFFLEGTVTNFFIVKSPEVGRYYYYSVFIALTLSIYVLSTSNVRLIKRVSVPAFLKDVFLRLMIMGSLIMFGFNVIDFHGFIVLLCVSYLVMTIIAVIYSYNLIPIHLSFDVNKIDKADIRTTLNFSLLTFLASVSNIIIMNADSLMITALSKDGLTDTGIYTIAFFIGSILEVPRRIINLIIGPFIAEYWTDNKMEKIKETYQSVSLNSILLGSVIFGLIWLNLETLYQFIPNSSIYIKGLSVVLFILIARYFEMICSIAPNILTQTKLYIYNLPLSIVLVVLTVGTNYLLIPKYGIIGAAIATMLSIILYNLLKIILIWFQFKMQPFSIKAIKFLVFFVVLMLVKEVLPEEQSFVFIGIKNMVFLGLLTSFAIIDNTSSEFNKILKKGFRIIKRD